MKEVFFLTQEQVPEVHRASLALYGGLDGLREPGLLGSALMQPEAVHYHGQGDLSAMAAAYAYHIAQNQPFLDGNKRAAMGSALVFLELNGINTANFDGQQLYDAMIGIAEKRLEKAGLAEVFRRQLAR